MYCSAPIVSESSLAIRRDMESTWPTMYTLRFGSSSRSPTGDIGTLLCFVMRSVEEYVV